MILLKDEENQKTKDLLEKCLMLLWDVRLEIGHSVRTIDECIEESTNDITVATNIMESRLLAGSEALFDEMKDKTSAEHIWDSKSFFQSKPFQTTIEIYKEVTNLSTGHSMIYM